MGERGVSALQPTSERAAFGERKHGGSVGFQPHENCEPRKSGPSGPASFNIKPSPPACPQHWRNDSLEPCTKNSTSKIDGPAKTSIAGGRRTSSPSPPAML